MKKSGRRIVPTRSLITMKLHPTVGANVRSASLASSAPTPLIASAVYAAKTAGALKVPARSPQLEIRTLTATLV
jgi:hypothetical protein